MSKNNPKRQVSAQNRPVSQRDGQVAVRERQGVPKNRTTPPVAEAVEPSWFSQHAAKLLAALAVLAIVGGVVGVALSGRTPAPEVIVTTPDPVTGIDPAAGLPIDGYGALTQAVAAPVIIDIYSDFSCPFCQRFEEAYADQILELAADPNVSVRLHPVAVLRTGADGFSTMAGQILLEVAASHPEYVWSVNDFLLANQSAFGGMSGSELVSVINQAGIPLPPMADMAASRGPLLSAMTDAFRNTGAQGVPHVRINGQPFNPGELPWPNNSLVAAAAANQH